MHTTLWYKNLSVEYQSTFVMAHDSNLIAAVTIIGNYIKYHPDSSNKENISLKLIRYVGLLIPWLSSQFKARKLLRMISQSYWHSNRMRSVTQNHGKHALVKSPNEINRPAIDNFNFENIKLERLDSANSLAYQKSEEYGPPTRGKPIVHQEKPQVTSGMVKIDGA